MEQFLSDLIATQSGLDASISALLASVIVWLVPALAFLTVVLFLYFTRNFNDHVVYSANKIVQNPDGSYTLQLRTLQTLPYADLFKSNFAFRLALMNALRRVKKDDPFVRMSARDMDVLQPDVINGFSALYAGGITGWLRGESVQETICFLAISYEKYDDAKSRKIRAIVATEEVLQLILDPSVRERLVFEREHQKNRMLTLLKMAEHWSKEEQSLPDEYRIVRAATAYERL